MTHAKLMMQFSTLILLLCSLMAAPLGAQFDPSGSPVLTTRGGGFAHTQVWVTINDDFEGWLTLDSGADDHYLSKSAAEALGLKLEPHGRVSGVGASVQAFRTAAKELRVGPLRLQSPRFTIADVPGSSDQHGLLGSDLFRRAIVVYDTAAATCAIYDPETWQAPPLEWLPCELRDGRPFVRMQIEGQEVLLEVDTGGGQCVLLCSPAVDKLGLKDGRVTTDSPIQGPYGVAPGRSTRLRDVRLGALLIEDVPVTFAVEGKGWLGSDKYDGLIGAGLMCHTVVVFDYSKRRISFTDRRLFAELTQQEDTPLKLRPPVLDYTAVQATGEPNAVDQASYGKAWFPSDNGGKHWIDLSYVKPVRPQGIEVWGTLGQRGIVSIQFVAPDGTKVAADWAGTIKESLLDALGCTAGAVEIEQLVAKVRLELDCSLVEGTNVVDAVALVDAQGTKHWANKATASSCLMDVGRVPAFEATAALRRHATRLAAQDDAVGASRVRALIER